MALVCSSGKIGDILFTMFKDEQQVKTTIIKKKEKETVITDDFKQAKKHIEGLIKKTYDK